MQQHDHIREEADQKLIQQFENHPNKEAVQADLKQNRAFNPFSEQPMEMIYSMGNMEYFEICEITPNNAPTVRHTGQKVLFSAHAEHAYDLQTKFENSTVTATMFCLYPSKSSKRSRTIGNETGTRKGRKSTM